MPSSLARRRLTAPAKLSILAGVPLIYLDNHATTPLDPRVKAAMDDFLASGAGNPHSTSHAAGWRAREAVDQARREVASLAGAKPEAVVFTSGASEANNLAVLGLTLVGAGGHLICSAIEHRSVMAACRFAASRGCDLDLLPVSEEGLVEPAALAARLRPETRLVSVMAANNEIGAIQPIEEVAALCRDAGVAFHCDAAQAAGKVPLGFCPDGPDLVSLTAHKIHGPMGIGALLVRPGLELQPLLHGGGQERGLRPGTVPAALAVGFGAAARIALEEREAEAERLGALRDSLLAGLREALPGLRVLGGLERRLPGNLSVAVPGLPAEDWMLACPDLALSSGAACASGRQETSPVLLALGLSAEKANEAIRIGLGPLHHGRGNRQRSDAAD